jgi:hypothetical protein
VSLQRSALGFVVLFNLASVDLFAQSATLSGAVADDSGGRLPGVTVTATEVGTGRQTVDVTTERGEFRLVGLPAGRYTVQAELSGFSPTVLNNLELLVGQNATVNVTLRIASLNETVTVTTEAPLVDTRQAQVAGNVDRRQMEALPISGRNWLELTSMVKGVTGNVITDRPGVNSDSKYQLNLDGQQITQTGSVANFFGQPGISRDAIAEYQVVTNLFDVTMGRSAGMQIQAVSRAGTNTIAGSAYGFIRDDKLNAKDVFVNRVLPYENRQLGGTLGGPILRDKVHYFGAFEYETEPRTNVFSPAALPGQVLTLPSDTTRRSWLARGDYQLNQKDHLTVRGNYSKKQNLEDYSTTLHPTGGSIGIVDSLTTTGNWSRVISGSLLQEVSLAYYHYHWYFAPMDSAPLTPAYYFPGLTLGPQWNYPEDWNQDYTTGRYNLNWRKGNHDIKIGTELRMGKDSGWWMARSRGEMFLSALPADAVRRFPLADWADPTKWDFSGLDASVSRFDMFFAELGGQNQGRGNWSFDVPRPTYAVWYGDNWAVSPRLTLNLGLRYDVAWRDTSPPLLNETDIIINNGKFTENVGYRNGIRDLDNISPRFGFTWNVRGDSRTVVRGGSGIFYGQIGSNQAVDHQLYNGQRVIGKSFVNDGRPGFIQDPTRGLTTADVVAGRGPNTPQSVSVIAHDYTMPYTWQTILGVQQQLNSVLGFDADLIYWKGYSEDSQRDPNLFYNPATGFQQSPSVVGRPAAAYGPINLKESHGHSEHLALATSLTRRYRDNFQLGATYTLMFFKNDTGIGNAGYQATQINPFDIEFDWARSTEFQRHTFQVNGLWNLPYDFAVSGSFRYGSGNYQTLNAGVDPLRLGLSRIRNDLSVIRRNTFLQDPWQNLSLRFSKDFRLGGTARASLIGEVFNVYNYERFGRNVIETSPNFGRPSSAGAPPRTGQIAFRFSF